MGEIRTLSSTKSRGLSKNHRVENAHFSTRCQVSARSRARDRSQRKINSQLPTTDAFPTSNLQRVSCFQLPISNDSRVQLPNECSFVERSTISNGSRSGDRRLELGVDPRSGWELGKRQS